MIFQSWSPSRMRQCTPSTWKIHQKFVPAPNEAILVSTESLPKELYDYKKWERKQTQ